MTGKHSLLYKMKDNIIRMTLNNNYHTINQDQIQVNLHKYSEHLGWHKMFSFSQAFSQQTVSTVHGGIETHAVSLVMKTLSKPETWHFS